MPPMPRFILSSLLGLTLGMTISSDSLIAQRTGSGMHSPPCSAEAVPKAELERALEPNNQRPQTPPGDVIAMFVDAQTAAPSLDAKGIEQVVDQLGACYDAGFEMRLYDLYTPGYLRRNPEGVCVRLQILGGTGGPTQASATPSARSRVRFAVEEIRSLSDGRAVGLLASIVDGIKQPPDLIIVFAKVGDTWRIDEAVEGLDPSRLIDPQATPIAFQPYNCPGLERSPSP